jgi:DNA-binding GntR family transcriptional regulator
MEPLSPLPPIQRQRLADQAYDVLREQILRRELQPGQRLSVPRIATELGLSRSPVREAVQRLVSEGLGVEQVHRGAVVAGVDPRELDEMYEIRARLEGLAARRAAARSDSALVADLGDLLERHVAAIEQQSEPEIIRADLAFHARVLEAADSGHLTRVLNPILGRANLAMLAGDLRVWPLDAVVEHRAVLEGIAAGNQDLAEAAARSHVEKVHDRLGSRLADHPQEPPVVP